MSVIAVAIGLSDVGLPNIGVREYSVREGAERDRLLRNLLGLRLVVTGVGTLVAIAFAPSPTTAGDGPGNALAGLALLLTTVQQTLAVPLSAELRLGWLSTLDMLRQRASWSRSSSWCSPARTARVPRRAGSDRARRSRRDRLLVRHLVSLRPAFAFGEWWRLRRVVFPYAAANAVGVLYGSLAIILLSLVATTEETGYFGAAFRVFLVLAGIPTLLVTSAFPILARAARDDHERLAYALQRLWDISLIVGAGSRS